MKGFRKERAEGRFRREVSEAIETELTLTDDTPSVSVSRVDLSKDGGRLKVFLLPQTGDVADERAFLRPFRDGSGQIRTALTARLALRRAPEISFHLDIGAMNAARIDTLLKRVEKRSKKGLALFVLFALGSAQAETATLERLEQSSKIMGSEFRIALYGEKLIRLSAAATAAFDEAERIDALLSNYQEDSELSRVNRSAGAGPVFVSAELASLFERCLKYSEQSEGAFDITVGPLVRVWGFYRGKGEWPGERAVQNALGKVGYQDLAVEGEAVAFLESGLELDPGGIGKGYAVDRMAKILREYDVEAALISAGTSSIYAIGAPPGSPEGWRVEIQEPRDNSSVAATVHLRDNSLSTSGSNEKFFTHEGKTYSHVIDPRSGQPAQGLLAVSVLADETIDSEAWTTAIFVNGSEWAKRGAPAELKIFVCSSTASCGWIDR